MRVNKVWVNGRLVEHARASISVFDRGFMYGDGLFETMRAYGGRVFMIDEHLDRLFRSLKSVRIKVPGLKSFYKSEIYRLLRANGLTSAYIRLTVTRGEGRFGIEYKDLSKPNIVIIAKEFTNYPEAMYEKGISARVVTARQNDLSPLARVKSLNFMNYILARFEAKDMGSDEAVVLNSNGFVAESPTSNIFIVKDLNLITPAISSGALPGITRQLIMELASCAKLKVVEKAVRPEHLVKSDEIFLTNTLAEVLPVTRFNGKKISSGLPGPVTRELHKLYQKTVIRSLLRV